MSHSQTLNRFKANPIEVLIFAVITAVFCHSVYSLFYESPDFSPNSTLSSFPTGTNTPERHLASTPSTTAAILALNCDSPLKQETPLSQVRLSGFLCGLKEDSNARRLTKTVIFNQANQFQATIFTDLFTSTFSTDYIPLIAGENKIRVEFSYFDSQSFSQEILLTHPVAPSEASF